MKSGIKGLEITQKQNDIIKVTSESYRTHYFNHKLHVGGSKNVYLDTKF